MRPFFTIACLWLGLCFCIIPASLFAQFQAQKTRILFLLDGSGSMNSQWKEKSKFETAKNILYHLADSLENSNDHLEFAVRVFGHQFPRSANNCNDTKLEIPFAPHNAQIIQKRLSELTPQGHTPIALSLKEAAADFPKDPNSNNVIILITDGIENCDGLPCSSVDLLVKNRISLKPYIISLSQDDAFEKLFPCKEQFYVANNPDDLSQTTGLIIQQVLEPTTVQLNLLDKMNKATVTNVTVVFSDHYSHQSLYSFVHALHANGQSDTLMLDPRGVYDITIYTTPVVRKEGVEIEPGRHNIIPISLPIGGCEVQYEKGVRQNALEPEKTVVVRQSYNTEILSTQSPNDTSRYLADDYDLEVLTRPIIHRNLFWVESQKNKHLVVPPDGHLVILSPGNGHLAVFNMMKEECKKVWETEKCEAREEIKIQPGSYWVVYRSNDHPETDFTKTRLTDIESSKDALVKF